MTGFKGTADKLTEAPRWFRDEDGFEWAGPHKAGESCPWGSCGSKDYRPLLEPDAPGAPGTDRPWCHTIEGDQANWDSFVEDREFIKVVE